MRQETRNQMWIIQKDIVIIVVTAGIQTSKKHPSRLWIQNMSGISADFIQWRRIQIEHNVNLFINDQRTLHHPIKTTPILDPHTCWYYCPLSTCLFGAQVSASFHTASTLTQPITNEEGVHSPGPTTYVPVTALPSRSWGAGRGVVSVCVIVCV